MKSNNKNIKAIILSAGKGTRMKSKLPKVVHKVCGKEMVNHVIEASKKAGVNEVIAILGHGADIVEKRIPSDTITVIQKEQLGTGHAVSIARENINDNDIIVVLCGDTPLIKEDTLKDLFEYHTQNGYDATVLTTKVENPTGYGRVIRDLNGNVLKIVEQKDANKDELLVNEINSGIYCFNGKELRESLLLLKNDNAQGEYYLTDTIAILRNKNKKVGAFNGSTIEELMGVNSRVELSVAEAIMRDRINKSHMVNGVTFIDSNSTYIESDVTIGNDTIIYPFVKIEGKSIIGSDCTIDSFTNIKNSIIEDGCYTYNSSIINSKFENNSKIINEK